MEAIEAGVLSGPCEVPETGTAEPAKKIFVIGEICTTYRFLKTKSRRLGDRRGTVLQSNWVAIAHFPLVFAVIEQALASTANYNSTCLLQSSSLVLLALVPVPRLQRVFCCAHAVRESQLIFRPLFSVTTIRRPPSRSPENAALIPPPKATGYSIER